MNAVKKQIQKEEYIALAVNKYILHTGKLPINSENSFDWSVLKTKEYLGEMFNNKNPITNKTIKITFDENNNIMIKGALEKSSDYDIKNAYLYNFYINRVFRVNTSAAKSTNVQELLKGSQVLYPKLQKQIVRLLKDKKIIKLDNETCPNSNYFYELKNKELTYKYCKGSTSLEVYQDSPIYLENPEDLAYVKAKSIGDKAYVQKSAKWYEYYYQGDVSVPWMPVDASKSFVSQNPDEDLEDKILSYIPNSKDLVLRNDGGCMLANGDIFCWGNNTNKKAGIYGTGQLDFNLFADYVNTPVMLRVQINDSTRKNKRWYNNPYRVKFEKMAMNSTNVCGISPIFDYYKSGEYYKSGGDLYCNGKLSSTYFDDLENSKISTILKRNTYFYTGKNDNKQNNQGEKYLIDLAMVDDAIAVLDSEGKIYTYGKNDKGALGQNIRNEKHISKTINEIYLPSASKVKFQKLYALRNLKCFGALDEYNRFWIWGERIDGSLIAPTKIGENLYDKNAIFVNSSDFVLKGLNNKFYRTYDISSVKQILSDVPEVLAVAINDNANGTQEYLYIDGKRQLQGSASKLKECRDENNNKCNRNDSKIFNNSLSQLNKLYMESNNEEYASFSNIGIFNISSLKPPNYRKKFPRQFHNFEWASAWKYYKNGVESKFPISSATYYPGPIRTTNYVGRQGGTNILNSMKYTYNLGRFHRNKRVKIKFDFLRVDSWDKNEIDYIEAVANGKPLGKYKTSWKTNEGVKTVNLQRKGQPYFDNDRIIPLEYEANLDDNGVLVLEIQGKLNSWVHNESWGIDNVSVEDIDPSSKLIEGKKYVCAMTGLGSKSQMYCWGEVGRSLPLLSTSLYDHTKVDRMNKLFVNDNKDKKKQLFFDEFNKDGNLFLKYPVYIGGFDYEFYFK